MGKSERDRALKDASERYSASDQARLPESGSRPRGKSSTPSKAWRGHPKAGEGDHGYRRDKGTGGATVDGPPGRR
jgi:hypothetical protein